MYIMTSKPFRLVKVFNRLPMMFQLIDVDEHELFNFILLSHKLVLSEI